MFHRNSQWSTAFQFFLTHFVLMSSFLLVHATIATDTEPVRQWPLPPSQSANDPVPIQWSPMYIWEMHEDSYWMFCWISSSFEHYSKVSWMLIYSQLAFTCSNSTTENQTNEWNLFKTNNRDIIDIILVSLLLPWDIFPHCLYVLTLSK